MFTLGGARERYLIYQTIKFLFEVLESCGLVNLLGLPSFGLQEKKNKNKNVTLWQGVESHASSGPDSQKIQQGSHAPAHLTLYSGPALKAPLTRMPFSWLFILKNLAQILPSLSTHVAVRSFCTAPIITQSPPHMVSPSTAGRGPDPSLSLQTLMHGRCPSKCLMNE